MTRQPAVVRTWRPSPERCCLVGERVHPSFGPWTGLVRRPSFRQAGSLERMAGKFVEQQVRELNDRARRDRAPLQSKRHDGLVIRRLDFGERVGSETGQEPRGEVGDRNVVADARVAAPQQVGRRKPVDLGDTPLDATDELIQVAAAFLIDAMMRRKIPFPSATRPSGSAGCATCGRLCRCRYLASCAIFPW